MTVWYISKYASPVKYFFGTRHFYLAEEWVKMGHDVSIFTSNASHLTDKLPQFKGRVFHEVIEKVDTYWLNTFKSKKSSGFSRIISWLHFDLTLLRLSKRKIKKPDVVIISSLALTTVLPAWYLAKRYKAKLVLEVRDIWPLSAIILGGYSSKNLFIRLLSAVEKFGYNKADLVVGTMPNLVTHVRATIKRPVPCICIPQGVSTDFYLNKQEELPASYINQWIPRNKFIVCYCGTINVNNPLDTLVEAAVRLKDDDRFHFIILGNGDKKSAIQEKVKDIGNVSFPPVIDKNKVNSFLQHVDVCYDSFDSQLAEYGLSRNKWIDYMFAAKPIICSFDGYQSMINEAGCGVFVKFGDSDQLVCALLKYVVCSKDEMMAMGNNGKKFILNNRTFQKLAADYLYHIGGL